MTGARLLLDVPLEPAIGSRFQPTGFPDIGAAEFDRPVPTGDGVSDWQQCLLVESAQSMANRLESVAWDDGADRPTAVFDGLPYVRVVAESDGRYLTSSRVESHRLASAFIKDSQLDGTSMVEVIKERLGLRDDTPIPHAQVAAAVFELDPFCLLHGVFFADKRWPGQPKVSRALTSFVEATNVSRADSGGVKRDHVRHKLGDEGGNTAEGYGSVPFHRTEWTAQEIVASFSLDRRQLHSYGLGAAAGALLEDIALWEIRSLLDAGLRLRTACDLLPTTETLLDRAGVELRSIDDISASIRSGIDACRSLLGEGGPLEVRWADGGKRAKR